MAAQRNAFKVTGRVQGVFFRASAAAEAKRLGLLGWVRNCDDGSVEGMVEGPDADLDAFLDWCSEGPPGARVDHVAVIDITGEDERALEPFHVAPDGGPPKN